MITYGIWVLPPISELQDAHPHITQPWYADDTGAGGGFRRILEHFLDLQARGAPWGHFIEPTKSILVVATRIGARAEEFLRCMKIKVVTGSQYLQGFINKRAVKDIWLAEKLQG